MKIEFEQPLSFRMEVVETDDHAASMRVEVKIIVAQFQHTFGYEGAFWIACENWDEFKGALGSLETEAAVLQDMNGYFALGVHQDSSGLWLSWDCTKDDLGGGKKTKIAFSSRIDDDIFGQIKNKFLEFPSWW
ncbi:hypothetical protein [Massilia antarctica]|nr:hypothetical protein [Massilia sp. H27-R4]MCY0910954.1 hypothetical protein [Massilia sp. H27-R4]CUI08756.1 hypothetical protein BN2497_12289 [Janthinobacterium sp. CG23_2]CUU32542.1 hypothetical protein BN3177_12289 [Janthinobacterium sp. CG23_2]